MYVLQVGIPTVRFGMRLIYAIITFHKGISYLFDIQCYYPEFGISGITRDDISTI